jgi:hypothetical protein
MSNRRKQARDTCGKFISKTDETLEETITLGEKLGRIWRNLKVLMFFLTCVFLTLPWSVMVYEPAKNYGTLAVDYVRNLTVDVHGNLCSCPLPDLRKERNF